MEKKHLSRKPKIEPATPKEQGMMLKEPFIIIAFNDQGQLFVQGNIDEQFYALGMLEVAKQAVVDMHKQKAAGQKIMPVMPGTQLKPFPKPN